MSELIDNDIDLGIEFLERLDSVVELLKLFDESEQVQLLNEAKLKLHEAGPFKDEPVDYVEWIPVEQVRANDYNPNQVAPPEMELLAHSIISDGYTQPVVTWASDDGREVVDGFHRNRVCREVPEVNARVKGYLPVVRIKEDREGRNDRIAATIRHNRARGKHQVSSMSDIVIELKRRNWSPKKIGKELGMDKDEVLRLCQVSGLRDMFSSHEFTEAWEVNGEDISPVLEVGRVELNDVENAGEE